MYYAVSIHITFFFAFGLIKYHKFQIAVTHIPRVEYFYMSTCINYL
jgi:hypothetical protein